MKSSRVVTILTVNKEVKTEIQSYSLYKVEISTLSLADSKVTFISTKLFFASSRKFFHKREDLNFF